MHGFPDFTELTNLSTRDAWPVSDTCFPTFRNGLSGLGDEMLGPISIIQSWFVIPPS